MKPQTNPIKKHLIIAFAIITTISCKDSAQTVLPELDEYKKKIAAYENEISDLKAQLEKPDIKKPDNIIQSEFAKKYIIYTT